MIFLDSETCGLCGPIVLFQWAEDDGPVHLESVWTQPIYKVIELYERVANHDDGIVGFNLAFDWFHICQQYTTLKLLRNKSRILGDCIQEYADRESEARLGPCIKPHKACDLMLIARRTHYQSTMERKDIRIRKVPIQLAESLITELNHRIKIKDIYFARKKKDKHEKWKMYPIKGPQSKDFCDIVLKFAPSSALKALAIDALGADPDEVMFFSDIDGNLQFPDEVAYAPFYPYSNWPILIRSHIDHWLYHHNARKYAEKDVIYTRKLYNYFDNPELGDYNSELACMVGATRWRGFSLDLDKIEKHRNKLYSLLEEKEGFDPDHIPTAPKQVLQRLFSCMTDIEKTVYTSLHGETTKKVALQELAKWDDEDNPGQPHKVAIIAQKVLAKRRAKYDKDIDEKLLKAGRFHAEFKVSGTLSDRMAGGSERGGKNINPQGISHDSAIRELFRMQDKELGYILSGGDFESFEPTIAEAVYKDPALRKELLSGKKIHALFGVELFPGKTYDQVAKDKAGMYDIGKRGVFALIYGGDANTLKMKLNISLEVAEKACDGFFKKFPTMYRHREQAKQQFCSMRQPKGIGTKVEWHEPKEYAESLLGFKRFFTIENQICKALFELANKPPKQWLKYKLPVMRRDRVQTAGGALQSALYGAAFQIQATAMRAGINHEIQATGAGITKRLQRNLWDLQPSGVSSWLVQPFQVHDEVLIVHKNDIQLQDQINKIVKDTIEEFKSIVPLLGIDWKNNIHDWSCK